MLPVSGGTSQDKADRFVGGGRFWQIPGPPLGGLRALPGGDVMCRTQGSPPRMWPCQSRSPRSEQGSAQG
jgi:hypothetical protein